MVCDRELLSAPRCYGSNVIRATSYAGLGLAGVGNIECISRWCTLAAALARLTRRLRSSRRRRRRTTRNSGARRSRRAACRGPCWPPAGRRPSLQTMLPASTSARTLRGSRRSSSRGARCYARRATPTRSRPTRGTPVPRSTSACQPLLIGEPATSRVVGCRSAVRLETNRSTASPPSSPPHLAGLDLAGVQWSDAQACLPACDRCRSDELLQFCAVRPSPCRACRRDQRTLRRRARRRRASGQPAHRDSRGGSRVARRGATG